MIKKGNLLTTLSAIPAEYVVSFSVRPTAFSTGWSSVIHFTTGENCCKVGSRIPGVWFNNNILHICGAVNDNGNHCYNSKPIAKNEWTDVLIVNSKVGSKFWYTVYVNSIQIGRILNPSSRVYKNVKVYITDPWHKSFKGSLRNIQISAPGNLTKKFLTIFFQKEILKMSLKGMVKNVLFKNGSFIIFDTL